MAILPLTNEVRLRKNVVLNFLRSRKMKVYESFEKRGSGSGRVGFGEGSIQQRNALLFPPTAGRQCSCIAIFSATYSLVKNIKLWYSEDIHCILT